MAGVRGHWSLFVMPRHRRDHPLATSFDLKARIPILHYDQLYSVQEICTILGVKKTLVYNTLRNYAKHGAPYNANARTDRRPRILSQLICPSFEVLYIAVAPSTSTKSKSGFSLPEAFTFTSQQSGATFIACTIRGNTPAHLQLSATRWRAQHT